MRQASWICIFTYFLQALWQSGYSGVWFGLIFICFDWFAITDGKYEIRNRFQGVTITLISSLFH